MTDHDVEIRNREHCPTCEGPAVTRCRCFIGDRTCAKGHKWYVCPVHGTRILGDGHSKAGATGKPFECLCVNPKVSML